VFIANLAARFKSGRALIRRRRVTITGEVVVTAAAVVAIVILLGTSTIELEVSRTTTTIVTTRTAIAGTTTLTNFVPSQLYEVTFVQVSACREYIHPWGVQLGNLSIVQPPTVSLNQIPSNGAYTASGNFNLTVIVFSVPSGTYPFTVYPTGILAPELNNTAIGNFHDWSGTITVTNSSVTVDMGCNELVLGT